MAYNNLRDFLARLEKNQQLVRITVPVSQDLEITEIADRVMKGDPAKNLALLFESVRGHTIPVAINLFGTEQRMAWALGVECLDDLTKKLSEFIALDMPHSMMEKAQRGLEMLNALKTTEPHYVGKGACQEVVMDPPRLSSLPIIQCWPKDAGRYITLPSVFSRDPKTGKRNVGMYRLQVIDDQTLAMHWQSQKGGAEHERVARDTGITKIPVAISLGGDPAMIWAGSAPLPPNIDEIMLTGWLRGKSVDLVKCVSQPIEVPADAEIIIEGYVDPREQIVEGPFGDHTGYYSLPDHYPAMHVTAITHCRNPIYPTTIVGKPPMEDKWMGKAIERLFLPLIRLFLSEVVDVNMPVEGVFHNLVIVSIKKRYPGQPHKVMYGIWGMGLMMLTKTIIVVDSDVSVHDLSQIAFEVLSNYDPLRDVQIVSGPTDDLDHASIEKRFGGKMGIDATRKTDRDPGPHQPWPEEIEMSAEIKALVESRWKEYGL